MPASVVAENISVKFPVFSASARSLKSAVVAAATGGLIRVADSNLVIVDALNAVSFKLREGDRLGVIGHNGSGKSTLLRVLAGIYSPASGYIRREGRTTALFDTSFGMDPEATGYENIFLRGYMLGMNHEEIRRQIEDITDFTDLGSFLELPVKTYSSGMVARLAFAISISISPEILLMDEGIGAGDLAFVKKADRRLVDLLGRAGILVLASHAMDLITRFCNCGIVLHKGRVIFFGPVTDAIECYQSAVPDIGGSLAALAPVSRSAA